jgi:RNA polymerase sigma factor (TIGR02999 family)
LLKRAASDRPDVTVLVDALARGEAAAHDRLFALVYDELKRVARAHIRRSGPAVTVNPTALLHEAWIRFARSDAAALQGSAHFYNVLAQAMRQTLLDLAERHATVRHGAGLLRTELTDRIEQPDKPLDELLALEAALGKLRDCDVQLAELVEWHSFVGLPLNEIARVRGVNPRTVKRHWSIARAFLGDAIRGNELSAGTPGRSPDAS